MDGTSFVDELKNGPETEPEENVFGSIWAEYERVILHSLVTSFGLDFLVSDQHGGDVRDASPAASGIGKTCHRFPYPFLSDT